MTTNNTPKVRLEPWAEDGLDLLRRTNTPEMTDNLGGPETEAQLLARHGRYLALKGDDGQMFRVVLLPEGEVVGSVGFWARDWRDEPVFETGYGIVPEFQGRGLAVAALKAVVEAAARQGGRRFVYAFPHVDHAASNAVCRKAGFELVGESEFEYPKGTFLLSNEWRADLVTSQ